MGPAKMLLLFFKFIITPSPHNLTSASQQNTSKPSLHKKGTQQPLWGVSWDCLPRVTLLSERVSPKSAQTSSFINYFQRTAITAAMFLQYFFYFNFLSYHLISNNSIITDFSTTKKIPMQTHTAEQLFCLYAKLNPEKAGIAWGWLSDWGRFHGCFKRLRE